MLNYSFDDTNQLRAILERFVDEVENRGEDDDFDIVAAFDGARESIVDREEL